MVINRTLALHITLSASTQGDTLLAPRILEALERLRKDGDFQEGAFEPSGRTWTFPVDGHDVTVKVTYANMYEESRLWNR